VPNLENAKKALRQSKKRYARNKIVRAEIDSLRRRFRKLLEAGKQEEAKAMIPTMDKKLDKAVTKSVYKKNKSARIKSRLHSAIARSAK
jgi:small subunit ribosomal protein S20